MYLIFSIIYFCLNLNAEGYKVKDITFDTNIETIKVKEKRLDKDSLKFKLKEREDFDDKSLHDLLTTSI